MAIVEMAHPTSLALYWLDFKTIQPIRKYYFKRQYIGLLHVQTGGPNIAKRGYLIT